MPQIAQIVETYASQLFWLLIVFGLIYFGIGRAMLPKIEQTVDARDKKIAGDLAAAQAARDAADASEEAYAKRMEQIRAEALATTQAAKAAAQADAERRLKAADTELADKGEAADRRLKASLDAALAGIEDVAAEATQDIVGRVAGLTVGRDEAAAAVRASLAR